MLVQAIMTPSPITASSSIVEAAKLMLDNRVSGLPVVDTHGALIGIVSEGDFLRRHELDTDRKRSWLLEWLTSPGKIAVEYVRAHSRRVEDVMTSHLTVILPGDSISDAVRLMERNDIKRLPVVSDGRLVGIISRADLLRAISQSSQPLAQSTKDADIQGGRRAPGDLVIAPSACTPNNLVILTGIATFKVSSSIYMIAWTRPRIEKAEPSFFAGLSARSIQTTPP